MSNHQDKLLNIDLDLARVAPSAVFDHPKDVLKASQLSVEQQIDILQRWAYDEREKAVAEEENMPDLAKKDRNILDEILRCLIELGVTSDEHSAPTKQG